MDKKNLKFQRYCQVVWYVAKNSIFVVGKVMGILKILGLIVAICRMLKNLCMTLSVLCPWLGSQGPGGGVVLGLDYSSPHVISNEHVFTRYLILVIVITLHLFIYVCLYIIIDVFVNIQ